MCKKCVECGKETTEKPVVIPSDSNGNLTLQLCLECSEIQEFLAKQEESFIIVEDNCEINCKRLYLVDEDTQYRVRIFNRTLSGVNVAVNNFHEGLAHEHLYKMP